MELRPYISADRAACLQVFDSNVPGFVSASRRIEFEAFLDSLAGPYFVMEHEGRVLGCGGYTVTPQSGNGELVWGMIRQDAQRLGLGRLLLMFRLREVGKVDGIHSVRAETSRQAARFFEGQGFKMASAAGDRVEMVKKADGLRVMRFTTVGLAAICAFAQVTIPIENAGFESGKPGQSPDGWANGGGYAGYPATISTENPHSGRQCALLRTDNGARVRDYGVLSQIIDTAPLRKRSIRLRLFARTATEADGRPAVFYRIDREGDQSREPGRSKDDQPLFANKAIAGNEWREYTMEVDVPHDAIRMQFGVTLNGDGRVWVDDVVIAILGKGPI